MVIAVSPCCFLMVSSTDSFYLMIFSLDFVIAGYSFLPISIEKE